MTLAAVHYDCLLPVSAERLYTAWTTGWELWLADRDTVRATAREGEPFCFAVTEPGTTPAVCHPHYGRFLELVADRLVRCTWVTRGTVGAETQLLVQFAPVADGGTHCTLTHSGFADTSTREQHAAAWPAVLAAQGNRLASRSDRDFEAARRRARDVGRANRSMPDATLIPTRSYPDPEAAVHWLQDVLGCVERLREPGPRVQLTMGNGAVVVAAWDPASAPSTGGRPPATLLVRVPNVDDTYARALAHGATSLSAPTTLPFGERQAAVRDPAGHTWTLSQTVADVDPTTWGASPVVNRA